MSTCLKNVRIEMNINFVQDANQLLGWKNLILMSMSDLIRLELLFVNCAKRVFTLPMNKDGKSIY